MEREGEEEREREREEAERCGENVMKSNAYRFEYAKRSWR